MRVNAILLGTFGFLVSFKCITDSDLFWHMAAGRWILENRSFIYSDPFSFTYKGHNWISITWGYEVLIYVFYKALGFVGVNLIHSLACAATAVFSYLNFLSFKPKLENRLHELVLFIFFVLAIVSIENRWHQRPEVFSHMWGMIFLYLLLKNEKTIWLLPLWQVFWTNMHGLFIFGPILVGVFLVARVFEKNEKQVKRLGILLFLTSAAMFINPRGSEGALFPFHLLQLLRDPFFQSTIPEATNPFEHGNWSFDTFVFVTWFILSVSAATFSFWKNRKPPWELLFLVFGLSWTALNARRNIPLVVLWTLPFVARVVMDGVTQFWRTPSLKLSNIWNPLRFVLFALLAGVIVTDIARFSSGSVRFGFGQRGGYFSDRAHEFFKKSNLRGHVFANTEFANHMIFVDRNFESYIDSRFAELYPVEHFRKYMDIKAHPFLLNEEAKKWGIESVALNFDSDLSSQMAWALSQQKDWQPVYLDTSLIVFAKTEFAKTYYNGLTRSDFTKNLAQAVSISDFSNLSWHQKTDQTRQYLALSQVLSVLGEAKESQRYLSMAFSIDPSFDELYTQRCRLEYFTLNEKMSKLEKSENNEEKQKIIQSTESACRQALRVKRGKDTSSEQIIASIYMNTGRARAAVDVFYKVTQKDPLNVQAHLGLGMAAGQYGQLDLAEKSMREAYRLRPFDPTPIQKLAEIYESHNLKDESERVRKILEARQ